MYIWEVKFLRPGRKAWEVRKVCGMKDKGADKMVLYFPGGAIEEVPEWSKCGLQLGEDWVQVTKDIEAAEKRAKIKVAPEP